MLTNLQQIVLAPMEGVLDYQVRQLLTELNDIDYCVTEFVRVTHHRLTKRTFYRLCPELSQQGKTLSGTPVRVQLLGQSPELMAENAAYATELGSYGIDINCGCPAKTVVGSQGGAYLLKSPELIYQIARQVRAAIAPEQTLSIKIRLGFDDKSRCFEIADAVAQGGANEVVIHGRTKQDGYQRDKIDWQTIGKIKQTLSIPVIANGEIFSPLDAQHCLIQTGTNRIMLGRGILTRPNLANMIRHNQPPLAWPAVLSILQQYAQSTSPEEQVSLKPLYHSARIKQWLSYLKQHYPQAVLLLERVRKLKTQQEMLDSLTMC
ncbi:tRNA-U20a,U20b-dihydrouridine synthase [Orbus hercynius]|uniref:tRNA-dihydrouridine(16) synthase n=1 Tax=Orbus hercynius TaxID=593135 RepID=A0A495RK53_9GAMM|nr:tRNA dihydrouridine(16) synthase DusC [Orbus hercynius]RKS87680.1 tRNA-U20a,U20b-dihydrouridine synthase [Orbus hercynius]